jgi:HprK-related kinase A
MTGESGAGKSTLAAILGEQGWRLLGDEFALLDPDSGMIAPFPRPISLKNGAIGLFADAVSPDRLGPLLRDTPKGAIRHLRPNAEALARMAEPAKPALILFPRYGRQQEEAVRPVGASEVFVRLTQASTNYVAMGERGFAALTSLVRATPACAIDYRDAAGATALVEQLWRELAS